MLDSGSNISNISQDLNNLTIQAGQLRQKLSAESSPVTNESPIRAKKEEGVWKFLNFFKIFQRFRQSPEQIERNQNLTQLYEGLRSASKNIESVKKEIGKCKDPQQKLTLENDLKNLFRESQKLEIEIGQISSLCIKNAQFANTKLIKKIESEEIGLINRIRDALIVGGNEHLNAIKEMNQKLKAMESEIILENQGFYTVNYDPLREIEKLAREINAVEKKINGSRVNDLVQEDIDKAKKLMKEIGKLSISLSSDKETRAAKLSKLETIIRDTNDATEPLKQFVLEKQEPLPQETLQALRIHLQDPTNFSDFVKRFKTIQGNVSTNLNEIIDLLEKTRQKGSVKDSEIIKEGIDKLNANLIKNEILPILNKKNQNLPSDLRDALEIALQSKENRKAFKEKITANADSKEKGNIALILSVIETDWQSKRDKLETPELSKQERIQLEKDIQVLENVIDSHKEPLIAEGIEDLKRYFSEKNLPLSSKVVDAISVSFDTTENFSNFLNSINFDNSEEIIVKDINLLSKLLQTSLDGKKEIYEKSELSENDKLLLEKQIETLENGIEILRENFKKYVKENAQQPVENIQKYFIEKQRPLPIETLEALKIHLHNPENFTSFVNRFKTMKGDVTTNLNTLVDLLEKSLNEMKEKENVKGVEMIKEGVDKLNGQLANQAKEEMLSIFEKKNQNLPPDLNDALEIALLSKENRKEFKEKITIDEDPDEKRNIVLILKIIETDLGYKKTRLETSKLGKQEREQLEDDIHILENALDHHMESVTSETIDHLERYFSKKDFPLPSEVVNAMSVAFDSATNIHNFLRWINFENPEKVIINDITAFSRSLQSSLNKKIELHAKDELDIEKKLILEGEIEILENGIKALNQKFTEYVLDNTQTYFNNRGYNFTNRSKEALKIVLSGEKDLQNFVKDMNFDASKEIQFNDFYLLHDLFSKELKLKDLDNITKIKLKSALELNKTNIESYYESLIKKSTPETKKVFKQLLTTIEFPIPLNQKIAFLELSQNAEFLTNLKEVIEDHRQILKQINSVKRETIQEYSVKAYSNLVPFLSNPMYHSFGKDLVYLLSAKLGEWGNIQFSSDSMALAISTNEEVLGSGPATRYMSRINDLKKNSADFSFEERMLIKDNYFFNETFLVWMKNDWAVENKDSERSPFSSILTISFALPGVKPAEEIVPLDLSEFGEFNQSEKLILLSFIEKRIGSDKKEKQNASLNFLNPDQFKKLQQIAESFEEDLRNAATRAYQELGKKL